MGHLGAGDTTPRHPEHLLALTIRRAYAAFAGHRIGATMAVWRPEVTADDVAALGGPLRQVTAEAIDRWLPHATTTWGTAADVRALLPRVLELFAAGRLRTPPEVLCSKLRLAGVGSWSVEEQAAVEDVITAVWLSVLASYPTVVGHPAWRLLVSLAELGDDVGPFLEDWHLMLRAAAPERASARRHLLDLMGAVGRQVQAGGEVGDLFWTPQPEAAARLERWLRTPFTESQLTA